MPGNASGEGGYNVGPPVVSRPRLLKFGLPTAGGGLMTGSGRTLSYGGKKSSKPFNWRTFAGGWNMGTPVLPASVGGSASYDDAILRGARNPLPTNPANVDGSTNFVNTLQGFGGALLQSIGGQPDTAPNPYIQQASFGPDTVGGVDIKVIAIVALVGAGIVYAFNKK